MSEIEAKTQSLQPVKHPSRSSVVVITPKINSGKLEFDSQPRPWIFHFLQWISSQARNSLFDQIGLNLKFGYAAQRSVRVVQ